MFSVNQASAVGHQRSVSSPDSSNQSDQANANNTRDHGCDCERSRLGQSKNKNQDAPDSENQASKVTADGESVHGDATVRIRTGFALHEQSLKTILVLWFGFSDG